jgi:hypothetical protein
MDESICMYSAVPPSGEYQEIDMPEWLGNRPTSLYLAHWFVPAGEPWGTPFSGSMVTPTGPDWSADFHTYAINWQPNSITYYVDGIQFYQVTDNVPQDPMYFVLLSGTGGPGSWGGAVDPSILPNSMLVDYVRVYQGGGTTPPVPVSPPNPPPPSPSPLSPDGSVISAGQGGSLTTSEGTWTFGGVSPDGVDSVEELNGVANGWATEMEIVNGSLYAHNTYGAGGWYLRQNGTWVNTGTTAPSSPSLSPDGSVIYAGQGGSLTTSEGTWTFGGVSPDGVDSVEELNGVANGWATEMEIVNGSLYAHNTYGAGGWYLRQNGTWVNVGPTAP